MEQKFKITGLIILLSLFITSCSEENKSVIHTKSDALIASQMFVEKQLNAPGSAKFPYQEEDAIDQLNDSTFVIVSYVDSQNDLGVLIRNYYKCKIIYSNTGKVKCEDLQFETH